MITLSPREILSLLLFLGLLAVLCGLEVVLLIRCVLHRMRRRGGRRVLLTRPALAVHALIITVALCLFYGYFVEPCWIEVSTTTIHTARLRNTSFRIVQISDLHCDRKPRNEGRIVRIVNQLKPDVIVLTGDLLNHASALPRQQALLGAIEAPLGKLAVKGNFEIGYWKHLDLLRNTGFRWLDRDTVMVEKGDERVAFSGLSFDLSGAWPDLLQGVGGDYFHILLFHTPDLIEDIRGMGVDLYLCGHTHGGQVVLPWYGAIITFSKFGKKYESGPYESDGTMLYVNRGLGLEPKPAPQVRFLARLEIAVFDIVPE